MRRLFMILALGLIFVNTAYGHDWTGTYYIPDHTYVLGEHNYIAEIRIQNGEGGYDAFFHVNEYRVMNPVGCTLRGLRAKEENGQLYIYEPNGRHILTIAMNNDGFSLHMVPNTEGLFRTCTAFMRPVEEMEDAKPEKSEEEIKKHIDGMRLELMQAQDEQPATYK